MERVLIIGCSGAGKSVLSRRLSEALGLPVIHLDRYYWRPGWVAPDKATWIAQVDAMVAQPRWIMDGNYGGTLPLRLASADAVVFLDFPTWLCLFRVFRRTIAGFGRPRADVAPGCPQRFDWPFVKFVWSYRRIHRQRVYTALQDFKGLLSVLKGRDDVQSFLRQMESAT